jgi:WD40 repeat protein
VFSPDGRCVVAGHRDGRLTIWEIRTERSGKRIGKSYVWGPDFSPTGQYLVTGGEDCRIVLWRYREVASDPFWGKDPEVNIDATHF